MLAPIAYRGPDDEVFHEGAGIGLGFRRLAIVDPEHGRQPMTSADGRLTLVHNGEIYNHAILREGLRGRGHTFRTRSDSEVVLAAYAEWGPRAVERLRGIFAFAVWDEREGTLFLARDRSGVKPLYLHARGDDLLFASEAKAILAAREVPRALDWVGLFGSPPLDAHLERSPFRGISALGAGTTLTLGPDGVTRTHRYFRYAPRVDADPDERDDEIVERFRAELADVVEMQLMSDVPLGACLSGGLDSSFVSALASEATPSLETFTTVTEGSLDAWNAFVLARAKGLRAHYLGFDPIASTALLERVAWGAEGLFDFAFVSRYELASAARDRGIRVLLSGQGIDELVGGYDGSPEAMARAAVRADLEARLAGTAHADLTALLASPASPTSPEVAESVVEHLRHLHASLAGYLLRFEDRMGMLAGVEVRVPFLDHVIVEACAAISPGARARLFGDKRLVREAARGLLPETVRARPKFAMNANMPSLSSAVLGRPGELAALLGDAVVHDKGHFDVARVRHLRETRNERLLDAVLVTHLLDELFVSRFDPARFADRPPPRPPEVVVDESFLPAEAILFAARRGGRAGDAPSRRREIAFVGRLASVAPSLEGARAELFLVRTTGGEELSISLPPDLPADRAVAFLCAIDGLRTYAELATDLGATVDEVLALGRFFAEREWVKHERRA